MFLRQGSCPLLAGAAPSVRSDVCATRLGLTARRTCASRLQPTAGAILIRRSKPGYARAHTERVSVVTAASTQATHRAYCDETRYNVGRVRGLGMVSAPASEVARLDEELRAVLAA